MSFFGKKINSGIKPQPASFRSEKVAVAKKPAPIPSKVASQKSLEVRKKRDVRLSPAVSSARSSPAARSEESDRGSRPPHNKRKAMRKEVKVNFDDDDDDDGSAIDFESAKRRKTNRAIDTSRMLVGDYVLHPDGKSLPFIHAADTLRSVNDSKEMQGAAMDDEVVSVELKYPTDCPAEKFHLVFINDQINPAQEIKNVIELVADIYLKPDQQPLFTEKENGIVRKIQKAYNHIQHNVENEQKVKAEQRRARASEKKAKRAALLAGTETVETAQVVGTGGTIGPVNGDNQNKYETPEPEEPVDQVNKVDKQLLHQLKGAVELYNTTLTELSKSGPLARNLATINNPPLEMVTCVLDQVYGRAVAPKVDILKRRKAQEDKDSTYGEIKPIFGSEALTRAGLDSTKIFLDLGSGTGNVVLQAALEFGCMSVGCEMMEDACELARAQKAEFIARCRLWGIKHGKVKLCEGSFFEDKTTLEVIKKADVILVNNEVFSSETKLRLVHMFLDCKEGCKIISLQSFRAPGLEITVRNQGDPANQLDVEEFQYYPGYVSWKHGETGNYYISTKDSSRLGAFSAGL